ncbi:MAG: rRNA maturation RNase YbeY [Planctomycetota bacterium]
MKLRPRKSTPSGSPTPPPVLPDIGVTNQQQTLEIPAARVRGLVRFVLAAEQREGRVEITFVDDARIAQIHQQFLGVSGPTDVITFPIDDGDEDALRGDELPLPLLGEIVVSTDTAKRQAPDFGNEPLLEVLLYVVHGVLHLVGYDDRAPADRQRMESRQSELLAAWRAQE